jgi:shikimate kinase
MRTGTLLWRRAAGPVIVARTEHGGDRPALTEGKSFTEEVEEVLRVRTPLYEAAADEQVDTDRHSPGQVADEVARRYAARRKSGTTDEHG